MPKKLVMKVFARVDAPIFPKIRTNHYLTNQEGFGNIQESIENSICFGELGKGFFGKKQGIALNSLHYGSAIDVPFFTKYRTARNEFGESLSTHYSFNKNGVPINIFLLVKTPWRNLIKGDNGLYSLQGVIRSPDKELLPRVESELVKILEKNHSDF